MKILKTKLLLAFFISGFFLFGLAGVSEAATCDYYVATTGNNDDPGTLAKPWRTLKYAESRLSDGDVVCVREGTYKENFKIDVDNVTFQNYNNEKPVIDGDEEIPGDWIPLVEIISDGVTFDGFEVRESSGTGISLGGNNNNVTIKNCEIHETYRQALQIVKSNNALIEDCNIYKGAKVYYIWEDTKGRPPTVTIKYSDSPTFRRCKIHDSYFENIDVDVGTTNATIEYCEIYGSFRVQLYLVNSVNNTVRYNLIYGTTIGGYPGKDGHGPGIYINNEEQWSTPVLVTNNKIYGNLVANTKANFWIAGKTGMIVKNVTAYNNIFVESTDFNVRMEGTTGGEHVFKNNIIWETNNTIASLPSGKMDCDNNLWSKAPDPDAQGPNDPAYAIPQLAKITGWNNITGGSLKGSDFTLQSTSPAINAGTNLGAPYNQGLNSASTWVNNVSTLNQNDYGNWEIGAFVYADVPTDDTDPIVVSFTANPTIVNTNDTITFSYRVTDETALEQVELYRTTDKGGSPDDDNWSWIKTDDTISGTSALGSFTDSISIAGTYWYGLHVVDEAGNRGYEPSPVKVIVNEIAPCDYYVATTGNNGDPGTLAKPWKTLKYAESKLSNGDVVCVREGTYHEMFTINVPNVTFQNYQNEKPVIDGQWTLPTDAAQWAFPIDPDFKKTTFLSLVTIIAADVVFNGFEIKNATGTGLKVYGVGHDNVIVRNCSIHDVYRYCLQLSHQAKNTLIEDCDIYAGAQCVSIFCGGNWAKCREDGYPGDPSMVTTPSANGAIFRRTKIHDSHNEGINLEHGANNITVEYCEIYGNRKSQLYVVSSTNHTVRYNLIYGADLSNASPTLGGAGVGINHESQWISEMGNPIITNHKIYGNLIANLNTGIRIGGNIDRSSQNVYMYNNTLVHNKKYGLSIFSGVGQNSVFKNNIILNPLGQIANVPSGMTFSNNLWSQPKASVDTDAQGSGDIYGQIPQLTKTSGWDNLTGGELNGNRPWQSV